MAWTSVTIQGDDITIEADPAVDLSGGRLKGLYMCRARALTAAYARRGTDVDIVLVTAISDDRALAKVAKAIESGMMIRREFVHPPERQVKKAAPPA